MADLTINADSVAIVRADEADLITLPTGAAVTAGAGVYTDTDGTFDLADASAAGTLVAAAVAVRGSNYVGDAITAVKRGFVSLGDALDGFDPGDPIYFSDTPGALSDSAGTVSKVAGHVVPAFGDISLDATMLLFVDVEG